MYQHKQIRKAINADRDLLSSSSTQLSPPKDRNGLPIKSCMELFNDITKVSSCMLVCFHYMKPVVQNLAFWKQTFIFYYII